MSSEGPLWNQPDSDSETDSTFQDLHVQPLNPDDIVLIKASLFSRALVFKCYINTKLNDLNSLSAYPPHMLLSVGNWE